ncbi:hypothetical protein C8J57DRAFT_1243163 [Mycena rebaudengoi]|nr:hypothetical protein C8J57DRAFT_1243163 [Mycena rebaudengoi]
MCYQAPAAAATARSLPRRIRSELIHLPSGTIAGTTTSGDGAFLPPPGVPYQQLRERTRRERNVRLCGSNSMCEYARGEGLGGGEGGARGGRARLGDAQRAHEDGARCGLARPETRVDSAGQRREEDREGGNFDPPRRAYAMTRAQGSLAHVRGATGAGDARRRESRKSRCHGIIPREDIADELQRDHQRHGGSVFVAVPEQRMYRDGGLRARGSAIRGGDDGGHPIPQCSKNASVGEGHSFPQDHSSVRGPIAFLQDKEGMRGVEGGGVVVRRRAIAEEPAELLVEGPKGDMGEDLGKRARGVDEAFQGWHVDERSRAKRESAAVVMRGALGVTSPGPNVRAYSYPGVRSIRACQLR